MKTYNKKFFNSLLMARKSAEAIITELSHYIKPKTVVDGERALEFSYQSIKGRTQEKS